MTSCRTETQTVRRMQKAWPFGYCRSHQSVESSSLLVSGLTVDILSTVCGVYMLQCV